MPRTPATEAGIRRRLATAACVAFACALTPLATASATDVNALQAKVEAARSQASSLASELQATQSRLSTAQAQASAAAAREQQLSGLLATGEARSAALAGRVKGAQHRLGVQQGRLARAKKALAQRLVAIYESGTPSTAGVVLGSSSFDDLATRTDYLREIEDSDAALAQRVAQVRNEVRRGFARVAALKDRVDAYNARLSSARSQISAVRARAGAKAGQLQSISASRAASLSKLKSNIGSWVADIQQAQQASRAAAENTVGRWLGGPYAIPTYIVMCESGGDYSAVNPSSGAGGAYQILPSTWRLYGGQGNPQDAPKAEQDRIAAQIWADSGPSAWSCG
jgi:peptidoglycan hydrolase CwlO-like protein